MGVLRVDLPQRLDQDLGHRPVPVHLVVGGDDALYSDALGEPTSPGGTYPGMIRHNVDVIVGALTR